MKEIVFVDCDLTLVKTDVYPMLCKQIFLDRRKNKYFFQWRFVATEARPTAQGLLEELGKKYKVHILSLGHSVFQTRVLTELGLIDLVDKIWGPDNVHELSRPDNFVLIDDMSPESLGISYKMTWLGRKRTLLSTTDYLSLVDQHLIRCRAYEGGAEVDQHLTDFLPLVDQMIDKQLFEKKQQQLEQQKQQQQHRKNTQDITVRTAAQDKN